MAYKKCPRCELNYIQDGEKLCSVCRKEVRGESERDEVTELCSECGENPVVPGSELCINCLKELTHRLQDDSSDEVVIPEEHALDIDSVSTMDEIELDLGDDIAGEDFSEEDDDFKDNDKKPPKKDDDEDDDFRDR
jgi:hypothetical protein